MPGKMVYELQPRIDWHKGKALLYLLDALGPEREGVTPIYLATIGPMSTRLRRWRIVGSGFLRAAPTIPKSPPGRQRGSTSYMRRTTWSIFCSR